MVQALAQDQQRGREGVVLRKGVLRGGAPQAEGGQAVEGVLHRFQRQVQLRLRRQARSQRDLAYAAVGFSQRRSAVR